MIFRGFQIFQMECVSHHFISSAVDRLVSCHNETGSSEIEIEFEYNYLLKHRKIIILIIINDIVPIS